MGVDGIRTKTSVMESERSQQTSSRKSLTTIMEEVSAERSSFDSRLKPVSNSNGATSASSFLAGFLDDLEKRLQENLVNVNLDLQSLLREPKFEQSAVGAKFQQYSDGQLTKAAKSDVVAGLDKVDYFMKGLISREGQAGQFFESGWGGEDRQAGDAKRGIELRCRQLRDSMKEELDKLRKARLERLESLFEGHLNHKGKQFLNDLKKNLKMAASKDERTSFYMALKQKNADDAETCFRMRKEVEELQMKISKL
jgi:hypothetical protein